MQLREFLNTKTCAEISNRVLIESISYVYVSNTDRIVPFTYDDKAMTFEKWFDLMCDSLLLLRYDRHKARMAWDAALVNVPDGWTIVPSQPTQEMLDAVVKKSGGDYVKTCAHAAWPVMLEAAPRLTKKPTTPAPENHLRNSVD